MKGVNFMGSSNAGSSATIGKNTMGISKVGTMAFVGMTCALVASIRNIPSVAATGWTMFFYMLVAVLLYGFPISMIAGEYAGMFPQAGGPELWVTHSLGKKWGFVVSWLLWVQMFPGMVMVASVLAPMLGEVVNNNVLGSNNIFTLVCILAVYWGVTLLNLKFDMAKIGGKIGIWLGLYIPIAILLILGLAALGKVGFNPSSTLGTFSPEKLLPDTTTKMTLEYFAPIIFIFVGIEMSSVYITRIKNPVKTYVKGIFIALIFMFLFNAVSAFVVANVVPAGKMELNNISQSIVLFCDILGLPHIIANIFSLLVFLGVAVQLSAWASGPSKTITQSARRGQYPPKFKFWKTNENDVSKAVLFTQATIISIFALVYLLIPAVNSAFLTLVSATTLLYCFVYIFMGLGILKFRKTHPQQSRPFRIGKKGNGILWGLTVILFATIVFAIALTLMEMTIVSIIAILAISFGLLVVPLIIDKLKKPSWATEVQKLMDGEQHNIPQKSMADLHKAAQKTAKTK